MPSPTSQQRFESYGATVTRPEKDSRMSNSALIFSPRGTRLTTEEDSNGGSGGETQNTYTLGTVASDLSSVTQIPNTNSVRVSGATSSDTDSEMSQKPLLISGPESDSDHGDRSKTLSNSLIHNNNMHASSQSGASKADVKLRQTAVIDSDIGPAFSGGTEETLKRNSEESNAGMLSISMRPSDCTFDAAVTRESACASVPLGEAESLLAVERHSTTTTTKLSPFSRLCAWAGERTNHFYAVAILSVVIFTLNSELLQLLGKNLKVSHMASLFICHLGGLLLAPWLPELWRRTTESTDSTKFASSLPHCDTNLNLSSKSERDKNRVTPTKEILTHQQSSDVNNSSSLDAKPEKNQDIERDNYLFSSISVNSDRVNLVPELIKPLRCVKFWSHGIVLSALLMGYNWCFVAAMEYVPTSTVVGLFQFNVFLSYQFELFLFGSSANLKRISEGINSKLNNINVFFEAAAA